MIQLWLWFRSMFASVWGVIIYDYNSGDPEKVGEWTWANWEEYEAVKINFLTNGRDAVYLFCYKQGNNRGWFEVMTSHGKRWSVIFWDRQYYAAYAYRDAILKCREFARDLGFKLPTDDPISDVKDAA